VRSERHSLFHIGVFTNSARTSLRHRHAHADRGVAVPPLQLVFSTTPMASTSGWWCWVWPSPPRYLRDRKGHPQPREIKNLTGPRQRRARIFGRAVLRGTGDGGRGRGTGTGDGDEGEWGGGTPPL
jgi:hypothetical protein